MYTYTYGVIEFNDNFNEPIPKKLKKKIGEFDTIILGSNYSKISKCKIGRIRQIKIIIKNKYTIQYYYDDRIIVEFNEEFNEELTSGDIDNINSCTEVIVHKNYDKSLELIAGRVEYIKIKNSYTIYPNDKNLIEISENIPINEKLYNTISKYSKIKFTDEFNQPIGNLHNGLEELEINSSDFNQPLDNLPNTIKKIFLYLNYYKYQLDNLPDSVEYLCLYLIGDGKYISPIDNLPSSLKYLKINCYNCKINNLPANLHELEICGDLCHPINNLPVNLKNLTFDIYKSFDDRTELFIPDLPDGLEFLHINGCHHKPINNIPSSLKTLILPNRQSILYLFD